MILTILLVAIFAYIVYLGLVEAHKQVTYDDTMRVEIRYLEGRCTKLQAEIAQLVKGGVK